MIQKFISKLSKNERKIFNITFVIVLFAFLDLLFLRPVLNRLHVIDEEIVSQKSSIKGDLRILSYKDRIQKKNEAFKKYISPKPQDDDVVNGNFLSMIEKLATQSKVSLVKSNISEKKEQKKYTEYYANLDCTGDLKDIFTFMHLINSTEELLKVVKVNMVPKRGTQSEVNVSMTVTQLIMSSDDKIISLTKAE